VFICAYCDSARFCNSVSCVYVCNHCCEARSIVFPTSDKVSFTRPSNDFPFYGCSCPMALHRLVRVHAWELHKRFKRRASHSSTTFNVWYHRSHHRSWMDNNTFHEIDLAQSSSRILPFDENIHANTQKNLWEAVIRWRLKFFLKKN